MNDWLKGHYNNYKCNTVKGEDNIIFRKQETVFQLWTEFKKYYTQEQNNLIINQFKLN